MTTDRSREALDLAEAADALEQARARHAAALDAYRKAGAVLLPTGNICDAKLPARPADRRRAGGSMGWAGRGVIPENPPAWHYTTPPWEEKPAGA